MNDIASTSLSSGGQAQAARPLALADLAGERQEQLPRDYPRAPGDTIALSTQAREIAAGPGAYPPAHPAGVGDHATRSVPIGPRQIGVDASGSYKLD